MFAGGGAALELTHIGLAGSELVHDDTGVRPVAFAGGAIEWVREYVPRHGVGIGIDVRGVWLGGSGPASSAPQLARLGVQATLELNMYLGRPAGSRAPDRGGGGGERYTARR